MDRPNHIEDALVKIHSGQWFTWTDSKNKIYANLRLTDKYWMNDVAISNPYSLPTEEEINAKLIELQTAFDNHFAEYKVNRRKEYPSIEELVVALYDSEDRAAIEAKRAEVKARFPKNE